MKHVLVLNQFALPRSQSGGTRHVDLFSRVDGWSPLIVVGNRNHYSQKVFRTDDKRFRLAWVPGYTGAGLARMAGWAMFAVQATAIGLTTRKVDVVYASTPQLLVPLGGALVATLRRVPLIVEVRDLWPESIVAAGALHRGSLLHQALVSLERWIYHRADQIVVVTPGWEDHFANLGVDLNKVHVVSNGTAAEDFIVDEDRVTLRRTQRISGFTAIFAGAHGPKDGIELILDAATELPMINFLLVGAGSSKIQAEERVQRENLKNVEFRTPVAKSDLAGLLSACDVGIHAVTPMTVFEKGMSPNKLFDYMASGLPVVSNAEHGLRAVVVDGECGHLGGPGSLRASLHKVHQATPEQRTEWGNRGREIMRVRFSRSAAADELRQILQAATSTR